MITEKMNQLMQQIKELELDYEFITEEEIEKSIKECKKENPNFEITEKSLEENLTEYLAFLKIYPEMEKIAEIDLSVNNIKSQEDYDSILFEINK